jgi:hypothetical protein
MVMMDLQAWAELLHSPGVQQIDQQLPLQQDRSGFLQAKQNLEVMEAVVPVVVAAVAAVDKVALLVSMEAETVAVAVAEADRAEAAELADGVADRRLPSLRIMSFNRKSDS